MKKRQQRYTPEFRAEAVKMLEGQGLSHEEAARRLGIPKGTLSNWAAAAKGRAEPVEPGAQSVADLQAQLKQLRKELAETRQERDILRKAAAYFARESLPGTRS